MTECVPAPRMAIVDDLLALRDRILEAVARRGAERPGSPARLATDAELEALHRRVWRRQDPDERGRSPASG
jgi:hypothetical protein